jgi:hypothetical protein
LEKFWLGSGSGTEQYLAQFSKNKKTLRDLALSMSEAALFLRKLAPHFDFLTFILHLFMLDPDPNPVPKPYCIPVPVPPRQKVMISVAPITAKSYDSCGSDSTTTL